MRKFFLYTLFISLFLAYSCGSRHVIKVKETNFIEEINQYQNLIFTFNHDLVADSLLEIWDTTAFLEISPKAPGKYKWTNNNELIFSPTDGFLPNTDYEVTLNKTLASYKKKLKRVENDKINFHTPYLKALSAYACWILSKDDLNSIMVQIIVQFNYPVNPASLKEHLNIEVDKENSEFYIETREASDEIKINISKPKGPEDESLPLKISIDKKLRCVGSNRTNEDDHEIFTYIPPQDELMITEVQSSFEDGKGIILIYTSQPILSENVSSFVKISPGLTFKVEKLPNGLKIKGDFKEDANYELTISGKIKGVFGKTMGDDYTQHINFGNLKPYLTFLDQESVYLSSHGTRNIELKIINIPKIKLSVYKVFANNMLHYLREGKEWDYYYDENIWKDFHHYGFKEKYGKVILEKEVKTDKLARNGSIRLLNLDLKEIGYNDEFKGFYIIRAESTEQTWLRDVIMVAVSDIGLMVKQGVNNAVVFANSVNEATPLSGVSLKFISYNNQVVYETSTDNKGVAVIENIKESFGDFNISMLTASYGDDFNFIWYKNSRNETSRFNTGGKRTHTINYDVFVYGDRDIYRPGDTLHFNTVVRDFDWNVYPEIPLTIKVVLPNGKMFRQFNKQLNEEGAVETSVLLPVDILTGVFTIDIYSGDNVLLQSKKFKVEEFVPDRIKVETKLNKEYYTKSDVVKSSLVATNLYGPPAANRNYEQELSLKRKYFTSDKYADYNFNIQTEHSIRFENNIREGKTNAEGKAEGSFSLPDYENIGLVQGKLYTTVFDETGRPVNRLNSFDWYTQNIFYGIKNFNYWLTTRKPVRINFVALNKKGVLLKNVQATVQIKRFNYETIIERDGSSYHYRSQKREFTVLNKQLTLNGTSGYISFTPVQSGEYEVRIMADEEDAYVSRKFYCYGWGDTDFTSFKVDKDGEIIIETNKEEYEVGEKASLLFKTPFSGELFVSIERDDVIEYHHLKTDKKAASLEINIKEKHLPNIYITATLIRKMAEKRMPLTVAHGIASVKIEKPDNKLPVNIIATEKSRSQKTQIIKVKSKPGTEVTLAVVDEGILQITGFKTPDPYTFFYGKRALEVNSYDIYNKLYPEIQQHVSSFGGGADMDLAKRINPLTSKRIKLIALWSGIMETNSKGECSFEVDIPQFSGSLRVMAVAYKQKRFGSASHTITVADPIVISPSLPRVLSPEDEVSMPVMVANTTSKTAKAKVELSLSGPLGYIDDKIQTITIKAHSESMVTFKLKAHKDIGNAKVNIDVGALGEKFRHKTEIAVRPPAGLQMRSGNGIVYSNKTKSFTPTSDFIPSTLESKLVVSRSPMVQFSKELTKLIRYPYGCIEQTVSTAFPQIYLKDIMKSIDIEPENRALNPDHNVQQAIRKVESLQQYEGGFSYWSGGYRINWWSSVYATHFLYEAKIAGYDVNQRILNKAFNYLNQRVKAKEKRYYYYYNNQGEFKKRLVASQETFYSLFLLSAAGKENRAVMNYYKSKPDLLTNDSKYMLAGAYSLIGDQKSFKKIIPGSSAKEISIRSLGGCFYSPIRDIAISLYTLIHADPENTKIPEMAKRLSELIKSEKWLSTQEKSFSFLALGKLARKNTENKAAATVYIDGSKAGNMDDISLVLNKNINNKNVKIVAEGKGSVYYYWVVEGISKSGSFLQEDNILMVRKNFYDRNGNLLKETTFSQNDLIVVEISIHTLDRASVENVAITDILPACFEIENPRISPERELNWIKKQGTYEYMDIRDDRISYFTTVSGKTTHYYYMVRAVSQGTYKMGPVSADAMYNGEYHSYHGAGVITVK